MIATPAPALIVPRQMNPTAEEYIAGLKTELRCRRMAEAGLDLQRYDPAKVSDTEATTIIAAHRKRVKRKIRNQREQFEQGVAAIQKGAFEAYAFVQGWVDSHEAYIQKIKQNGG